MPLCGGASELETSRPDRTFGRKAFGADPANYHAARPPYPEAIWVALRDRAHLSSGIDILEIGAGTGLATEKMLAHQPASLIAVEPDARLADYLHASFEAPQLTVLTTPFESVELAPASFDVVASATAFHWLDAASALRKIHVLLRPKGFVALWWNVFADPNRPDPFHDATHHLFAGQKTSLSSGGADRLEHALNAEARIQEFSTAGFVSHTPQYIPWTLTLDPAGVRGLYATYSNVSALAPLERIELLDALEKIAAEQFGRRVQRNMITAIYTAQRDS
jgi:SAM-dependent methyltransferase